MTRQLQDLGNVIGGARYFGACPCGSQHMSTHDRVYPLGGRIYCVRCAGKAAPLPGEHTPCVILDCIREKNHTGAHRCQISPSSGVVGVEAET